MQIQLPQDIANAVKAAAFLHGYEDVADYIAALVIRENKPEATKPVNYQNSPEWRERFREWTKSHSEMAHVVDVSRTSIYEDRGL